MNYKNIGSQFRAVASLAIAAGLLLTILSAMTPFAPTNAVAKVSRTEANDAQSDHIARLRISGNLAQAEWHIASTEGDNQTFTDVFVNVVEVASKQDNSNIPPYSLIDVAITEYEIIEECFTTPDDQLICNYEYVSLMEFFGFGEIKQPSEFIVANNLRSASVNSLQVIGYEYLSQQEMTVWVNATWTAGGSLLKLKQSYSDSNEDYTLTTKSIGTGRDAAATAQISGDININLDEQTSYEYEDASVMRVKQGEMIRFTTKS